MVKKLDTKVWTWYFFASNASVKTVGLAVGRKIQQGRQTKGWTQKDLAEVRTALTKNTDFTKQIQEKQVVVQQYENGKAIPNQKVITKLEKALGVSLRS